VSVRTEFYAAWACYVYTILYDIFFLTKYQISSTSIQVRRMNNVDTVDDDRSIVTKQDCFSQSAISISQSCTVPN